MNPAQFHLMVVHLPLVGALASLVLLGLALALRSEQLFKIACGFVLACLIFTGSAYWSGPYAYEFLEASYEVEKDLAEDHGVIGRAAFVAMILLGVVTLIAALQYVQGERPPQALRWGLLAGTALAFYLLAWSAHLGGRVRHPEARSLDLPFFPGL